MIFLRFFKFICISFTAAVPHALLLLPVLLFSLLLSNSFWGWTISYLVYEPRSWSAKSLCYAERLQWCECCGPVILAVIHKPNVRRSLQNSSHEYHHGTDGICEECTKIQVRDDMFLIRLPFLQARQTLSSPRVSLWEPNQFTKIERKN